MALIRSLNLRTIRVGSYFCPEIFSTCANQNTYDFHRSISYMNDNLNREFTNVRTNTSNYTVCSRHFHRTITNRIDVGIEDIDQEEVPEKDAEELLEDADYNAMVEEQYILPADGHSLMVIQPDMKIPWRKNHLTTADMQLEEACALVDSLPRWTVVEKAIYSLKHINKQTVYQKGNFEEITQRIRKNKSITAVFISLDMLSGLQLANLRKAFKVPVYDRYTIVLQIFKMRAKTKEAKLQVALAELPYFRSRLQGLHKGTLGQQRGTFDSVGGKGETSLEMKQRLIRNRQVQLKRALDRVKDQREMLKKERRRKEIPTVAVVGYTNSGKTSLIKAVTGDKDMVPLDKLFATLDVTVHAGLLPNRTKVLYVDTVGFISDIPTELIASFRATLHDMLTSDVIVHVIDISNPDQILQRENVLNTLNRLKIPDALKENIIEVGNKVDKLPRDIPYPEGCLLISATTGIGLDVLREQIQDVVIETTGRVKKKLKVRQGGPLLSWLHKQATVEATDVNPDDPEHLIVTAVFTEAQWGRFKSQFIPRNDRKKQKSQNIER